MKHTVPISAALPEIPFLARLPIFWAKELHVILTAAFAGTFCMLIGSYASEFTAGLSAWFVYPVVCSAIVAMAFGHDYIYRTLNSALALPVPRRKIFWTRIALCAAILFPMMIVNLVMLDRALVWAFISGRAVTLAQPWYWILGRFLSIAGMPALSALCLAPWLTMISRSPMFGAIISMAAPFVITRIFALMVEGTNIEASPLVFFNPRVLSVCFAIGAVLSYRKFMSLEAIETDVAAPSKFMRRAKADESRATKSESKNGFRILNPIAQLVKKEIRLQALPAGIGMLALGIVMLVEKEQAALLTLVYPAAIILLVGAIASADERRMGLIPSQVLQPVSFGKQWAVKIAVSYATAAIFGVLLPAMALHLRTDELKHVLPDVFLVAVPVVGWGVLLLLALSFYISSISDSGVRAMLVSIFVLILSVAAIGAAYDGYSHYLWEQYRDGQIFVRNGDADAYIGYSSALRFQTQAFAVSSLGFIALAFFFAMQNHRFLDRTFSRLAKQCGVFIAYEAAALLAIFLFLT